MKDYSLLEESSVELLEVIEYWLSHSGIDADQAHQYARAAIIEISEELGGGYVYLPYGREAVKKFLEVEVKGECQIVALNGNYENWQVVAMRIFGRSMSAIMAICGDKKKARNIAIMLVSEIASFAGGRLFYFPIQRKYKTYKRKQAAKKLRADGKTVKQISAELGVSEIYVYKLLN